ncbi:MAG: PadR family transcriptional regulator [Phycisphaerales bacterium JB043]
MEYCVLAVIWRRQPCTGYTVRKVFLGSFSSAYSGSAGAIYPLLGRMVKNGYLSAESAQTGKRKSVMHSLTEEGHRALCDWLCERPKPDETVGLDPVRVKLRFLGAIPRERRPEVIDTLLEQMRASLREIEEYSSDPEGEFADDPFFHQAFRFAREMHGMRIEWLEQHRDLFESIE